MLRSEVDRNKLSPMMQQYMEIKDQYPEELVFYRLGDFYEMFFDDALVASRELELTLTGRVAGLNERVPMCGVPFHSVKPYIEKLVNKGYKVAICDQLEDPKDAKGMEGELDKEKVKALHEIRKTVRKIIETYGYLFNGHTTIDNLTDEKIVTINLSTVKNLEKEVFMAYLFNMNSLCWDNCVANGSVMKAMNDRGEISYEDATKFCIIIDESHNWINASMPMIVELITKYMREAPKFFGGILMASHSIRDYFPEGTDSDVEKMKTLFELTQYKFLFLQDSSALNMIDKVLGPALTLSQRSAVTMLERGECVLVISGDRNINFNIAMNAAHCNRIAAYRNHRRC